MPAMKYLFIVKTKNSTSLSNSKHDGYRDIDINRHAQLAARRHRLEGKHIIKQDSRSREYVTKRSSTHSSRTHSICLNYPEHENEDVVEAVLSTKCTDSPTPIPAIDSVCTSVVSVDRDKQHVLEYYTKFWMPAPDIIHEGCQLTGMTPIRPMDSEIAFRVVRGAFQAEDCLSMYALLAAGSRRMKALHNMTLRDPGTAELYTIKAIQALRQVIENGNKPSPRMVLDVSLLMLAEIFTPSPTTRFDVFSRVLRDVILSCGGLSALPIFTAQFALGFDHHSSAFNLSKPALNPFAYPELVSICTDSQRSQAETDQLVMARLQTMDNKLRMLALQSQGLTLVVDEIQRFSEQAANNVRRLLSEHIRCLYDIVCEPLRRSADHSKVECGPNVIAADDLYLLLRVSAWRKWVIACAQNTTPFVAWVRPLLSDPPTILFELPHAWEVIHRIRRLLKSSGWLMRQDVVLWIAAVRYLTSTNINHRKHYQELLRSEAATLHVKSPLQLRTVLQRHFPLEPMYPHAYLEVWNAIHS